MNAKVTFKSYNQNELLLFPPCLGDLVPANHPVRVVNAVIDMLDISEVEATYKGGGTSSFNPRMLLKIVVMLSWRFIHNLQTLKQLMHRELSRY